LHQYAGDYLHVKRKENGEQKALRRSARVPTRNHFKGEFGMSIHQEATFPVASERVYDTDGTAGPILAIVKSPGLERNAFIRSASVR
jgi:hypothetical protein